MSVPISGLPTGVPNGLLEIPATNPLVPTESPQGTTFKYIFSDLQLYLLRAQGFDVYDACVVATTANLNATYSNGTAGVGATLTNSGVLAALTIDSIALSADDRVLVKDQTSSFENGIYVVTTAGSATVPWVLTRATDYNEPADIIYLGVVPINRGTVNSGLIFQENSTGPFVIGTSPITFQQLVFPTNLLPSASPPNKMLRSDGTYWVQSTNSELNASDALSGLTQLDVDNIRINGNSITSTDANGDINITPNGTGDLVLDGLNWPQVDGTASQVITTNGAGQLGWSTVSTVTTPTTDNAIARFDGTGGALQNSDVTIADNAKAAFITNGASPQVNYLEISSAPTGQSVNILTAGADAGINLWLIPKGGAQVAISTIGNQTPIVFGDGTHTAFFQFGGNAGNQYISFPDGGTGNGTVALTLGVPPTITNNAIPRYTGTDGYIQNSLVTIDNAGNIAGGTWQGTTVGVAYGGTGNTSVGANGTIAQSDGTKYTFTTATYPSTTSINHILYSSANNVIGQIADTVGGVLVSNNTGVPSMLANPADNYRVLMSQNAAIPLWSTAAYPRTASASGTLMQSDGTDWTNTQATYPSSTNKDHILYSSANNTVGEIATQKDAVLVSNHSNTPVWSSSMTDGQIIIGKTNDIPAAASITGSGSITVTPGPNSLTISSSASGTVNAGTINELAYYAANGSAVSGLTTANNGVLVTSAGGVPSISSTLPTAVQGNITSVGTIVSGTWNGGIIGSSYGGTGINNGSSTITLGGSLTTSGAFASTFTMTNTTAVTFPTSGTLATTSQLPTPSALTSVSDTNVTITLGGTPATALLQATSITMGWSGQLAVSRGGTGASAVGASGTLAQSDGSKYTFTTATYPSTATSAGTILRANGTNWLASTSTFADTYAASSLLYSNGANTVTGLATANSATLVTSSTGVPAWTSSMTNGQILIGSTGATPVPATLTAGPGVSIANAAGSITISGTGSGIGWTEVTGTTQTMSADNGYVSSNAGLVTLTLPTTAAFGTVINVQGKGAGGWKIAQNAGQVIHFGNVDTTTGATGYLASTNRYDSIQLLCITANTDWAVVSTQGVVTYN